MPTIVELEKQVWSKGAVPLRTFILRMASGATPLKADEDKYYSSKEEGGIPFVRVQNLSQTSELETDELKYVNELVHKHILKRSQVEGGDLLTKITGVGRMAVSAVAPVGFVGNINQHIVVSKTKSKEVSDVLAAYLNSEIGEKLASRRATGGTRPALDYPALRSIPIVLKPAIVEVLKKGVDQKHRKEAQVKALLDGIDSYLLSELGVTMPPEPENTVQNRMFQASWQQVTSGRFDPLYHQGNIYGSIADTSFDMVPLRKLVNYFQTGFAAGKGDQDMSGKGVIQIRPTNINDKRELIFDRNVYISPMAGDEYLQKGEVLFNNTNSQELVGKTVLFDLDGDYFCSNHMTRICTTGNLHNEYLTHLFNLYQRQKVFFKSCINWNNQSGINADILRKVLIPLPSITGQKAIAEHINKIREQAKVLAADAQHEFEQTKREIEQLILS